MQSQQALSHSSQYLAFRLGAEHYAVDILKVQEINGGAAITPLPDTPPYLKGVMNLRGAVIPVIGLRERFSLSPLAQDKQAVVIVVTLKRGVAGLLVDAVSDVLDLPASCIEPPPELIAGTSSSFLTGLAKTDDKLVALLDLDRALGANPLPAAAELLAAVA